MRTSDGDVVWGKDRNTGYDALATLHYLPKARMDLIERLTTDLHRRGVRVVTGRRSRCFLSIACFTSPANGHQAMVSVNPAIDRPSEVAEALAVHLAMVFLTGGPRRFRLTSANRGDMAIAKAWRLASCLCISDEEWDQSMAHHEEGHQIEERLGVTPRIVRARWHVWASKRGNLGIIHSDPLDTSLMHREAPTVWCDVV